MFSNLFVPLTDFSWYLVNKLILPLSFNSLTLFTDNCAPLNSSLLCIKFTFESFESSIAQSNALSPPPKIEIVFPLNIDLSLTE